MERDEADRWLAEYRAGTMDRRGFVTRLLAVGASAGTVAAFLEACGGGSTPKAEAPKDGAAPVDGAAKPAAPAEGELGELEKELSIYNWSDYISEETVPAFEKEFGVKVNYSTYESNEEMMAKLQVGAGGYDLVVPTGYIVTVLAAQNLLHPLNKKYLTNWGNVAPLFKSPQYDPDNKFGVPYQWGTTGIAFRKDKVNPPPDSWGVFLDPKYKGKMTQMDDLRDVIGSWLKYRGKSINATEAADLQQAKADAVAAKANLKAYLSAPVKGQLVAGDVWIAQLWNGDTAQARVEQPEIGYVLPKEGAGIWTDSLVIPASAPHKRAAHEFMNFVLRPEVAAGISNTTGYGTPVASAVEKMTTPVAYPTDEELKRLEYQKDLGVATELWDQIWTEIKSG
ncbi:MAG: spermidine/putrescine ABC transporter substrate-binding protein [Myxococcota bacterium]